MPSCNQNIYDYILGLAIGVFSLLYFLIYVGQIFIFYFPSTPDSIVNILAVVAYSIRTALWYANIIYRQTITYFKTRRQKRIPPQSRLAPSVLFRQPHFRQLPSYSRTNYCSNFSTSYLSQLLLQGAYLTTLHISSLSKSYLAILRSILYRLACQR